MPGAPGCSTAAAALGRRYEEYRRPAEDGSPAPLRVMQSLGAPRPTTNPYNKMLDEALGSTPGLTHLRFSWRTALLGRYDAFHWHWPEAKTHGSTWWKSAGKYVLTAALAFRHRLSRRIAVVRTVHNIELPDDDAARLWLLRFIDRHTDHRIVINETTPLPDGAPHSLILHGHYRDWYARATHRPTAYPAGSAPSAGSAATRAWRASSTPTPRRCGQSLR